jgi:hypothetical protein
MLYRQSPTEFKEDLNLVVASHLLPHRLAGTFYLRKACEEERK